MHGARRAIAVLVAAGFGCLHRPAPPPAAPAREPPPAAASPAEPAPPSEPSRGSQPPTPAPATPKPQPGGKAQTAKPSTAKPAKPPSAKPEPSKPPAANATAKATPSPHPPPAAKPTSPRAPATAWKVEGCLTAKTEQEAIQFSKQPRTKGAAVTFERAPGGAVVVHRLAHACCLSVNVTSRVEGGRYVVTERLSGKACRCLCDSTIRTTLVAAAGKHPVSVEVYALGLWGRAYEGTFEVR